MAETIIAPPLSRFPSEDEIAAMTHAELVVLRERLTSEAMDLTTRRQLRATLALYFKEERPRLEPHQRTQLVGLDQAGAQASTNGAGCWWEDWLDGKPIRVVVTPKASDEHLQNLAYFVRRPVEELLAFRDVGRHAAQS